MPKHRKSSTKQSALHSQHENNPEIKHQDLISLKKKKDEQKKIKQIRNSVQNELKKLFQKDQSTLKVYLKKKNDLREAKQRQESLIKSIEYKQWLQQMRQKTLLSQREITTKRKVQNSHNLYVALQRSKSNAKKRAQSTKSLLNKIKSERQLSQSRLLEYNKKKFMQIQTRKTQTRQENMRFFQKRHSNVIRTCRREVDDLERKSMMDKKQIQEIQKDLINVKKKTQSKINLIRKYDEDIHNIKAETFNISMSRVKLSSLSVSSSRIGEENMINSKNNSDKNKKSNSTGTKSFSLPNIQSNIHRN